MRNIVSDELLNSFVDNELDSAEKNELYETMESDQVLKSRACELRNLKEMVQHAYFQPDMDVDSPRRTQGSYMRRARAFAASVLLLLLGGISGWAISERHDASKYHNIMSLLQVMQDTAVKKEPGKIVVQVSDANPLRLKMALDETENLLKSYRQAEQKLDIEIVANGGGLDLLRSDVTPYKERIGAMQAKYPNLDVVVCNQSIDALRKSGVTVHLLPNVRKTSSALDEISARLQQGWDYVRI
jgi:intracellular sulfur oxidation DsrE/DsrF family protein